MFPNPALREKLLVNAKGIEGSIGPTIMRNWGDKSRLVYFFDHGSDADRGPYSPDHHCDITSDAEDEEHIVFITRPAVADWSNSEAVLKV